MFSNKQNPELTTLEKQIYNNHLAISRSLKNKPFKTKKNFEDIVDTDKHKFLKRIATLFEKHPEISQRTFFEAPYKLYPDTEYFGLDYFSTMKAVKCYTTYKKHLFLQDPDSQIDSVKDSLRFISHFCIENKIYFHQYPYHKTADMFTWMKHYKENKINIYAIMEFPNIYSAVRELAEDLQRFFISEFIENFQMLYQKYNNSKELKSYLKKATEVLEKFVEQSLKNAK